MEMLRCQPQPKRRMPQVEKDWCRAATRWTTFTRNCLTQHCWRNTRQKWEQGET